MKLWFTADTHFGHANIIKYCHRPFTGTDDMNEKLIKNWNERVKPEDTVIFNGDFVFRNTPGGKAGEGEIHRADYYRTKLNGSIIFIKGNHDNNNSLRTHIERMVIRYGGYRMNIVHNPLHADPTYEINIVGHVHDSWKIKRLNEKSIMINVGVDQWAFRPITWEEINKEFSKWKKNEKPTKTGNEVKQGTTPKEL